MAHSDPNPGWQKKLLKPRLPWRSQAILPADVSDGLVGVMLARENRLEDARYNKIAPNSFIVELSPENYGRNYQPIEADILQQWREKLLKHLVTTNSRQGRKEYRFGGQLQIVVRPSSDLKDSQARIWTRVQPDPPQITPERPPVAFLEMVPDGRRWPLYEGSNTIGRDETCDIHLDMPLVQDKRLVSGQHAYVDCRGRRCFLYDGSLQGKPSANGTYLNARRIPRQGQALDDGDQILLAAINPQHPQAETPGAVLLRIRMVGEV